MSVYLCTAAVSIIYIEFTPELHDCLASGTEEQTPSIHEQFPEGSFKRLFWEQQRQALISSSNQMRWHPTMIKWCLNIKLYSTAAYEAIRESGFISLPSTRTLRDYTHHIKSIIWETHIDNCLPHSKTTNGHKHVYF